MQRYYRIVVMRQEKQSYQAIASALGLTRRQVEHLHTHAQTHLMPRIQALQARERQRQKAKMAHPFTSVVTTTEAFFMSRLPIHIWTPQQQSIEFELELP